nr:uncharacterized mitochondrial protein AtMg00810-like [Tanacetum cinerariifolium]
MTNCSLWEVILNGDFPAPTRVIEGVLYPVAPTTAEQRLATKNELKGRGRNGTAEPQRRNVSVETSTSNALVSQCGGVGSYDWSFQAEEEPTNYALIAFSSSSSSSDNVAILLVYQQYEYVFEEDIKLLKLEVRLRDNALVSLRQTLEKAKQERDDFKLKLDKFQTSSKNLSDLLASQTHAKTGLDYNSQVFTRAMFDCDDYLSSGSDESLPPSPIYDRYQSGNGYHVVPPPYTGTFMPPKPDLVFNNAPNDIETGHSSFTVKLSPTRHNQNLSHTHRPSIPIIKDWVSDLEDESETKTSHPVPSFVSSTEQPTARNHAQRGNHKHYARMSLTNPQRHVIPIAVLTQSKLGPITTVRLVTTAVPKSSVSRPRQAKTIVTRTNSLPRRRINHSPSLQASNFTPKVTAVKAPMVNAAQVVQGKWEWKPKCPILDHVSRNTTASMTIKRFDYNDALGRSKSFMAWLNGGYVAFGGNLKGGKIFGKEKAGEEIEQQYVLFPVWSSGSTNPHNTDGDVAFDEKELDFKGRKPESKVNVSPSSSAQSKKHDDKTKREAKGKSPVESLTRYRNFSAVFEDLSNNSINEDNAAGTLVPAVGQLSPNSTNTFSAAGPLNAAASLSHGKSSCIDTSQLPDDPNMPELEDITYSDDEDDVGAEADFNNLETSITVSPIPTTRVHKDHPVTQIIGDLSLATQTKKEPKRVHQALKDPSQIEAMQEELLQFKMQKVWVLVDLPHGKIAIAYASFMGFSVYQIDVKSAFLYGTIKEEVYVCQPPGFEDHDYPYKVYKVVKVLYGLHQAPRACHDKYVAKILSKFGLTNGKSARAPIDAEKHLLKEPDGEDVDVYTYRSMIGSLMYLTSSRSDIMFVVCACAYFQVTPKASHLHAIKRIFRYLKGKPHLGLWYPKDSSFDLVAYSDSDYAGASLDRKSTTGGCQFLGCKLISCQCKKQTIMATSSTEAEYVVAASCYAQVLWIQNQLLDYGQFWTSVAVKKVNDITRLQALVDKKKEIFAELARMGYEKPSTKLTFYKAFFSSQWKFLIHILLQCMSAKRISWNEFSLSMASAIICLSTGRKFNISNYIFDSLVRNVDSPTIFYMYPRFLQLMIRKQVGDLLTHTTKYTSAALSQKVFANMRRVGKGFFGVETLLFERMIVEQHVAEGDDDEVHVEDVNAVGVATEGVVSAANDIDEDVVLEDAKDVAADAKDGQDVDIDESANIQGRTVESQVQIYQIDLEHANKVLIVTAASDTITAASTTITAADVLILAATTAAAPILIFAPSRRRKGVVIRDHQETATPSTIIHSEAKSKYKGKGILKEDNFVKRYQALKRKPQTKAQARKNMMIYLRNVAGFKMDYFKGMTYDDIRLIFEKNIDSNVAFLLKTKEQIDEEDRRALKRLNKSKEEKAAKKQKLDEEVEELKEDLEALWSLDKERFATTKPKNFSNNFLLITLGAMFEKPDIHAQI